MAEADECKSKATAASPAPSAGNPTPAAAAAKSPKSREEGELSSGEDVELPTCSAAPFASTMLIEPVHSLSQSSLAKSFKSGSSLSLANRQLQTLKTRNYSKNFKAKHLPFESRNSRTFSWQKKGSDDNLVISFSDDDSGSDSGESKTETTAERKDNAIRRDKYKMSMTQLQIRPKVPQPATNQLVSKKGSVSRASSSSYAKNSNASFRHPVASSAAKDSRTQMHIAATRTSASQAHGHVRDMNLADHSLETLRHEIAIRENELAQKKSVIQNKERVTGSQDDQWEQHNRKVDNQVAHHSRPASANSGELAPNERPVKRLKLNEHFNGNQVSDGQLRMQISSTKFSDLRSQLMEKSSWPKDKSNGHESGKGNSISRSDKGRHESNTYVPTSSKVLRTRLEDNENMVPVCKTEPSMVRNIGMPSKQVNNSIVAGDISCSYGQFEKETIPVDACTLLNQSASLAQVTPGVESTEVQKHVGVSRGLGASDLFPNNPASSSIANGGLIMPLETPSNPLDKFSSLVPDSKLSIGEDTNSRGSAQMGILGEEGVNLQSLLELEELHDKELEEAQELRRRCELEERHALKAHRKAQRALIDANERCAALYQKRELFSARLQGLLMEASSFMWPSRWQDHRTLFDSVKSVPKHSSDMLSGLDHQIPAESQILEQLGCKSIIQSPDGAPLEASYQQMNGHDSGDDQCCEPDASTSDPKENSAVNDICTPAYPPHIYTDDDEENFPSDNRSAESRLACESKMGKFEEENTNIDIEKERLFASENAQDYELLEASLRSKLVARFGMRTSSKSNMSNAVCHVDKARGNTLENEISSAFLDQHMHGKDKNHMSSSEGIERPGKSSRQHCAQPFCQTQGNNFSFNDESHRNTDPEQSNLFPKQSCTTTCGPVFSLPSSDLHNVSRHSKLILPGRCSGFTTIKDKDDMSRDANFEVMVSVPDIVGEYTIGYSMRFPVASKLGDDMNDFALDPFWPFCMFELRGKCNDDECPWQHVRNCTQRKLKQHRCSSSPTSDNHLDHLSIAEKSNNENESFHNLFQHLLPIPVYHIGSNLVKVDSHLSQTVLARSNWQYWQRGFCASFPLPVSVRRILPPDALFLQTGDGPVADHDNWSRHSLYFQSQDSTMTFIQGLPDSEQSLELALDYFCGSVYKPDRKKALMLLSRAIEAEPNSVVLWVVYLHIYYRKESGIGKDDMFFHAVQHNECSYELWLLYINSRVQLGERLNAYHDALSIFCHRTVTCHEETKYKSACILDIFLQMIDFLCMSGNLEKAIWKIYELLPTTSSEYSGDTLLSDVPSYLVVSDKCIFWICCIYLVIYRKLPEAVIQQFEFEKDLPFRIQWPSAHLTTDRKERTRELVKFAVDKVTSDIDENPQKRDQSALRALHFFAISHIRCVATLDGLHCSADLLVKYMKLYPTCIELVLMSARIQENCTADVVLGGFEEVVSNWPKEVPGIQCLWNQYVEHAIAHGRIELAEQLITCWFQCFWEVKDLPCRNLEGRDDGSCSSPALPSHVESEGDGHANLEDDIYGHLNLSVYRMLQKNLAEARLAVDEALKLASPEYFEHCVREHAALNLVIESESQKKGSSEVMLDLLSGYLGDSCYLRKSEPLSRRYYQSIRKPRIRQLIDGILGPVSLDFSLVNSVLEVCNGPSLIPERADEPKDLVNFVESLMEIVPANYQLALVVYRFTARSFSGPDVASDGIMFWASTVLVNSIIQAVPVAPETIWLEAANLLQNSETWGISKRFHEHAISVYPFSTKLWQSYLNLFKTSGNVDAIAEAARERGVELSQIPD
ncbi:uncharacterized protein LOC103716970 isoform X2 [Phoenix dactylifera]|uniref:Uncharacterized protein LOC103716970 isoform X2 n=1 Tax=Phoenix dactylifera TaxID=42345 RepID=A0A8B9A2W4_PHODC|nr:uncharacterized protein LOC103716970 isoform X2 [Phoenix dactylifera]